MDPLVTGSLISAGANLLGGLFGSNSAEKATRAQLAAQKEFAQHGVRWRVEDAKAAGLHPLYALGANVPSYSPVSVQDPMGEAISQAGQNIGRAVSSSMTSHERMMADLAVQQAKANLRETDARIGVLQSEDFRNRVEAFGTPSFPLVGGVGQSHLDRMLEGQDVGGAALRKMPGAYLTTDNPGVGKGSTPMSRTFDTASGVPLLLPGGMQGDASEALESLSESALLQYMAYKDSAAVFGPQWEDRFFDAYAPEWLRDLDDWFRENVAMEKGRRPGGPGKRIRRPLPYRRDFGP